MTDVSEFLLKTVNATSPDIIAKTSGLLSVVDGVVQLTSGIDDLGLLEMLGLPNPSNLFSATELLLLSNLLDMPNVMGVLSSDEVALLLGFITDPSIRNISALSFLSGILAQLNVNDATSISALLSKPGVSDLLSIADTLNGNDLALDPKTYEVVHDDQLTVATFFDPTEDLTFFPVEEDPTFDTVPNTILADVNPPVPISSISTPVGNEPPMGYKGQYPYVKSMHSESGHIQEVDDTPGNERLLEMHRTGTYREVNHDGRQVNKIVDNNYTIVAKNNHVYVEGTAELYVKGNIKIICLNDATIDVAGRVELNAGEDIRMKGRAIYMETTSGDISMYSAKNINMYSTANTNVLATGDVAIQAKGDMEVRSTEMNLTSGAAMNLLATADQNLESKADTNIKSGSNLVQSAGKSAGIRAGTTVSFDGTAIKNNRGSSQRADAATEAGSAELAKRTGLGAKLDREVSPVTSVVEELLQGTDDDPDEIKAVLGEALRTNRITQEEYDEKVNPKEVAPESTDSGKAKNTTAFIKSTRGIETMRDSTISGELKISENYKLCHFTNNRPKAGQHQLIAQQGLSKAQIAANLSLLAENCVEPIRKKFGSIVTINSGFRKGGGKSQHCKGQATDLTYGAKSRNVDEVLEIAKWIRDHVPFDQLILEYGDYEVWTHVSFNGSRQKQRGDVFSCRHPTADPPKYAPGLVKYPWSPK